jgi:3-oxoacyl-[acyl-carrier-protein] synthase-3
MSPFAHVTGWGMSVPEKILTNDDLAQIVDTNDEWIVSMTGIHRRHMAEKGETTASLATQAAIQALAMTDLEPHDIDLVIVATSTPEHLFPATACLVQDALGASRAGAFDLLAACTGFIFALNMAAQSIRTGAIRNALVIGSETLTRLINWEDRSTCILFGDGAGALLLQASERPGGVLGCVMRSDGSGGELLSVPAGGSRYPASAETLARKMHTIHMNGREVFRFATRVMATATKEAAARSGLRLSDVSLIIPHQANLRIIEAAARGLHMPMEKFVVNIGDYGNTSTASIPIAVCEAASDGRIRPGDNLIMVGFGAGLTWGALALQWVETARRVTLARRRRRTALTWLAHVRSFFRRLWRRVEGVLWGGRARPAA